VRANIPDWADEADATEFFRDLIQHELKLALWNLSLSSLTSVAMATRPSAWPELVRVVYKGYFSLFPDPPLIYGDKTNSYVSYLRNVSLAFPQPSLVHLVRNPLEAVGSQLSYTARVRAKFASHFENKPATLLEAWPVTNLAVEAYAKAKKFEIIRVLYEDFIDDPTKTVVSVAKFLGLKLPAAFLAENAWNRYPEAQSFLDWKSKSVQPASRLDIVNSGGQLGRYASAKAVRTAEHFEYLL
jgi:hypothetical protein